MNESAGAAGFPTAVGNLIAELQRSLVTPQRFAAALERWAAGEERRAAYARDVAAVYICYARELDRLGRVDAELYAWRAFDSLRSSPGSWGSDPVFFYGFDDLTRLERDAVETLARVAGAQVTVSLTYEPGHAALLARAEAVQELQPLAERVLELPALDQHYAPASRAALHGLERRLFSAGPERDGGERIDPGRAIRLLEAGGERAEAELVAAEVLVLRRAGVPAEEIVVVYRSLARSAPVVERVFDEYGIALASEHRVPLAHTALGRGLLGLARCAWWGPDRARPEDLLDYLRSPGVLERQEVADALEAGVRRDGLRTAGEARERLGWTLDEIDSLAAAADPGAELGRRARWLFAAPHRRSARQLDPGEELDARALSALLSALAELDELGETVDGLELIELLSELEVPAGAPARPGAVLLAEPLAIRARRFRAIFVGGLQEGEFPQPGAPEPFLSDERRRELAASAGLVLAPREDALARERYLFYACVSRATEQLVLSYRSSDEEGNLALPSPFIADVAELLVDGWVQRRRRRLLADVVWPAEEAPTARERLRGEAAAARAAAGRAGGADVGIESAAVTLGEAALEHVRHRTILSGGALESYASCPFKWFVERELAPARLEPEPDPIARGNFMHAALEDVIRRLQASVTPSTLADAYRILDEVIAELPEAVGRGRPEGVRAGIRAALEADLRRYLAHEAADGCGWDPEGIELRFGFEDDHGSLPALVLGDGPERIRLRGVIDRVDVEPGGSGRAVVRDYKSGSARAEHQGARWAADRQLQVALYMLVVRELLGLEPVAGLYQPLGGGDLRARGLFLDGAPVGTRVVATDARSREELDASLQDAAARAVAIAARLRSGRLEPCPETCSREGCLFPGICRSQG
jgi:RecB family exonuclease